MGFNKRYVDSKGTLLALRNDDLKNYYGKSDAIFFEDKLSSKVYDLYKKGLSYNEIISSLKQNTEDKTNEMY